MRSEEMAMFSNGISVELKKAAIGEMQGISTPCLSLIERTTDRPIFSQLVLVTNATHFALDKKYDTSSSGAVAAVQLGIETDLIGIGHLHIGTNAAPVATIAIKPTTNS